MNKYKLEPQRSAEIYTITDENDFLNNVHGRFPFVQRTQCNVSYFAYCPFCLNPIQLVSYTGSVRAHGKHIGNGKKVLYFKWDYDRYKYCPYASHKPYVLIEDNERLENLVDNILYMYSLLKENFDKVKYVIEITLGMSFSKSFWKESIDLFLNSRAYMSPYLTERNLPYIFLYFAMQHQSIYGQIISENSIFFCALKDYADLDLTKVYSRQNTEYYKISGPKRYIELRLRLYDYKQQAVNGEDISESMVAAIDERISGKTLFEGRIILSADFFDNLVKKKDTFRDEKILEMASENIPVLKLR